MQLIIYILNCILHMKWYYWQINSTCFQCTCDSYVNTWNGITNQQIDRPTNPCSTVLFEKLIVIQLVKIFPVFYGT